MKMSNLVAILDDEEDIVQLVSLHLSKAGFTVEGFVDVENFYNFIDSRIPDLIILDLMIPDTDGFEICKYLKKQDKFSSIPVIMLTAKSEETDKVLGLELGADDYVTKPFSPRELVARVKAVLRRRVQKDDERKIIVGDIMVIDTEKYEVTVNNEKVELTSTEFRILQLLCSKKGWVFTRNQILDHLWSEEKFVLDRTVDVHVRNLREKLGDASTFIKSVRGVGYKLED